MGFLLRGIQSGNQQNSGRFDGALYVRSVHGAVQAVLREERQSAETRPFYSAQLRSLCRRLSSGRAVAMAHTGSGRMRPLRLFCGHLLDRRIQSGRQALSGRGNRYVRAAGSGGRYRLCRRSRRRRFPGFFYRVNDAGPAVLHPLSASDCHRNFQADQEPTPQLKGRYIYGYFSLLQ